MTFQSPRIRIAFGFVLIVLLCDHALFGKLETWRTEGAPAFNKGKKERVVVSDTGKVRLGRTLKTLGAVDATRVWDLARDARGSLYAATGDE